jgi:hypothetical protein
VWEWLTKWDLYEINVEKSPAELYHAKVGSELTVRSLKSKEEGKCSVVYYDSINRRFCVVIKKDDGWMYDWFPQRQLL